MSAIKEKVHEIADIIGVTPDEIFSLGDKLFWEVKKEIDGGNIQKARTLVFNAKEDDGFVSSYS